MAKLKSTPAYLLHKASGQARVRIDGRDHYLGVYGSQESRRAYDDLIREWFDRQTDPRQLRITVADLCLIYLPFVETYYRRPDGSPTSEVGSIRDTLKILVGMHGTARIREYTPMKLREVRDEMIRRGFVRTSINQRIGRVRRMFRWAVAEGHVPADVFTGLQALAGLRAGRSAAAESEPVKPVSQALVDALEGHVSRQVWGLIRLQLATGMRPGEVVTMRGCDLNMVGKVWEYRPASHKTAHHGKDRVVFIGPRGQDVIREFLKPDLSAYLFSPSDARDEFDERRKASRKSKVTPSQAARQRKRKPAKQPGERYTVTSYGQAVRKGCEKAFQMPAELRNIPATLPEDERDRLKALASAWRAEWTWHPHQLRHNAATDLRREFGIEAARVILGHASASITEVYAEADRSKAREIAGRVG